MVNSQPEDLIPRLEARLSQPVRDALRACVRISAGHNAALYLVGGAVRDLLLERDNLDLDLALEGDVTPVAEALARETAGRAVLHDRFGTATVSGPGFRLDLARTRRETYAHPGALPAVEPASLAEDLARRDFSINAIALRLTPPAGELIDPHGGLEDIRAGRIRVLHDRSFQDDATRMLRAARYATRLGFGIEPGTEALIRRDLAYIDTISGSRLRRELAMLFMEPSAPDGSLLAHGLGILAAIHPQLRLTPDVAWRWREALDGRGRAPVDELGFCVLADPRSGDEVASLSARLHLAGRLETALQDLVRLRAAAGELAAAGDDPMRVVDLLEHRSPAAVWALSVLEAGAVADVVRRYLEEWRRVRPHLRGDDLISLGVSQGVLVGELLRLLRWARLEGKAQTREDEIAIVREELARRRGN
jgi:tRNA nucleotidyltransferase (CCA-adding enzyme)